MTTISFSQSHQTSDNNHRNHHHNRHGAVVEEINGLIKVFNDGCVERPLIVPSVPSFTNPSAKVTAFDTKLPNEIPTRVYIPTNDVSTRGYKTTLPLVIYFHGGGFCVGSAAWSCYHDFLTDLAGKARCVVVSVNYRLAPEHRLPAAYDDGVHIVNWLINQKIHNENSNWLSNCDLQNVFLAGDSAGANIAYQVAIRINNSGNFANKLNLKGIILIHPFFGGESRTSSEKQSQHSDSSSSALTLSASDTYWRLALPRGANRDHPWCNPLLSEKLPATMVFVAENDILRDRNLEMVKEMMKMKKKKKVRIEGVVHGGVGHCFHVLDKSQMSRDRLQDMIFRLRDFINH